MTNNKYSSRCTYKHNQSGYTGNIPSLKEILTSGPMSGQFAIAKQKGKKYLQTLGCYKQYYSYSLQLITTPT